MVINGIYNTNKPLTNVNKPLTSTENPLPAPINCLQRRRSLTGAENLVNNVISQAS